MTALPEYDRLETFGLWADAPDAQRREVVVSFGAATLVLSDKNDSPLAHWSLAALVVVRKTQLRVVYSPTEDGVETLEIYDPTMNEAITALKATAKVRKSNPGLVRRLIGAGVVVLFFAILMWFPKILSNYAASITPNAAARSLGNQMLLLHKGACSTSDARLVLATLAKNFGDGEVRRLVVADLGGVVSTRLPGNIIMVDRGLVERQNGPEAAAGHVLFQRQLEAEQQVLYDLFRYAGFFQTIGFLTGDKIEAKVLEGFANRVDFQDVNDTDALLASFALHGLSPMPFVRTHPPLQADFVGSPIQTQGPVLSDNQWAVLESVCLE